MFPLALNLGADISLIMDIYQKTAPIENTAQKLSFK